VHPTRLRAGRRAERPAVGHDGWAVVIVWTLVLSALAAWAYLRDTGRLEIHPAVIVTRSPRPLRREGEPTSASAPAVPRQNHCRVRGDILIVAGKMSLFATTGPRPVGLHPNNRLP
jgi:hypothetical protein